MRGMIVAAKSALIGKKCRSCPRVVRQGESVLVQQLRNVYGEDQLIWHTACMAVAVERAPVGRPPGDPVAQLTELRRSIARTGQRFPGRDVSKCRSARLLEDLETASS